MMMILKLDFLSSYVVYGVVVTHVFGNKIM